MADGLKSTTLALDGIAIIVNADSAISDLTVEQIAQIFKGEVTNWSEMGGADGAHRRMRPGRAAPAHGTALSLSPGRRTSVCSPRS